MPKKSESPTCPRCEKDVKRVKKLGKHHELGRCGCGDDWYRMSGGQWWPGMPDYLGGKRAS
jgi:hypothetical protein